MDADSKIQAMSEGGEMLAEILKKLVAIAKVRVKLSEIEDEARKLLMETGGEPAFMKVPGYKWATCINLNEGVVHGIPNGREIKDGDLVKIDVGLFFHGYYTDTSTSVLVGENDELQKFLAAGRVALEKAIEQVKMGNRVGHISQSIQETLAKFELKAVPELTGHGVGRELHEKPYVPGVLSSPIDNTPLLYDGQTLAIEIIYTSGKPDLILANDGWTINTKDGKIAGLFEETVAVTSQGPLRLTKID